jgi:hypothetical protein
MIEEQRRYIRFLTKNQTFAALRSGFDKVGKVLDISINGLAFSYIIEDTPVVKAFQVDIFQSENGFYLSNIPCRIIYDIPYSNPRYDLFIHPRRCGLCFGKLSKKQEDELIYFLKRYSKATVVQNGKSKAIEKRI